MSERYVSDDIDEIQNPLRSSELYDYLSRDEGRDCAMQGQLEQPSLGNLSLSRNKTRLIEQICPNLKHVDMHLRNLDCTSYKLRWDMKILVVLLLSLRLKQEKLTGWKIDDEEEVTWHLPEKKYVQQQDLVFL